MPGPNATLAIVDLIERLQAVVDDHGDDATIAAAHQPAYPIRLDIVGLAATRDLADDAIADDVDTPAARQTAEAELPTVWLVMDQPNPHDVNPYAPAALWEVMDAVDA